MLMLTSVGVYIAKSPTSTTNTLMTPKQYHILALLETKTSIEDTSWLASAFPGFKVFVAGGSKNRTWSSYRKDQENLVQAPDPGD